VGLLRTYSNRDLATRQLNDLIDKARSTPTVRSTTRIIPGKVRKLTRNQIDELTSLYQSGSSTYSLAKVYRIRRDQVSILLKRAGVEVRPGQVAKLSEKDKDRAAELYLSGLSLQKVGMQLGVTDNTVTKALEERGVKRRDPQGRVL
jgi:hypothetical protein